MMQRILAGLLGVSSTVSFFNNVPTLVSSLTSTEKFVSVRAAHTSLGGGLSSLARSTEIDTVEVVVSCGEPPSRATISS